MRNEDNDIEGLIEYWKSLERDFRYQNETKPARRFYDNSYKYLGIKPTGLTDNESDPPDFFLEFEGGLTINLEVTTFDYEIISKHNSFFQLLETIVVPLIDNNLKLLPNGSYLIYYFPGSQDEEDFESIRLEIPDFKYTISKNELKNFLERNIPVFFKEFHKKDKNTLSIINKDGNQVGKLHVSKLVNGEEPNYLLFPQTYQRLEEWDLIEFQDKLQVTISKKEDNYKKNETVLKQNDFPWWLLISDINGKMNTYQVKFDYKELEIKSDIFEKIFIIQNIFTKYQFIEIK